MLLFEAEQGLQRRCWITPNAARESYVAASIIAARWAIDVRRLIGSCQAQAARSKPTADEWVRDGLRHPQRFIQGTIDAELVEELCHQVPSAVRLNKEEPRNRLDYRAADKRHDACVYLPAC